MRSELIRQRSDVLNTQVITRNNGKRLGVIKELLVDIDRRKIVALRCWDATIHAPYERSTNRRCHPS